MPMRPFHHVCRLRYVATWFGLLCAIGAGLTPAQEISTEARRHFELARGAQDKGLFDTATQEYKATIRLAPAFAGGYSNLGLVEYVRGDFERSSVALDKALHLDPELVGPTLYLGIDHLKLNHPETALPYLLHATQLDPANKDAQSWLGTAYWAMGDSRSALRQWREADRRFPDDPDILFVLGEGYRKAADAEIGAVLKAASGTPLVHQVYGDIYLDQNALGKAAGHYRAALRADAHAPDIHFELGNVALKGEHLQEAQAEYTQQIELTPSSAAAKARLGEVELLEGQVAPALAHLGAALALSPLATVSALGLPPSFATANETYGDTMLAAFRAVLPDVQGTADGPARNLALALIAARLDQPELLASAWTKFASAIPQQPPAADLLGRAAQDFERESFEVAEAEGQTWLRAHPNDLAARYLLAKTHRLLSLGVLNRLLTAHPDSPRAHQLLAQTYEQGELDEKALAEYRKVEELAPSLPGVHLAVGHLLIKDGHLAQATLELKEELHLNAGMPEANAELGLALLTQRQASEAVEYLTKAVTSRPDLWLAHQELGRAYLLEKHYDDARRQLLLALADDPEGVAHYELGLVYKALGQSEEAALEFACSKKIKADRLAEANVSGPDGTTND